MRLTGRQRWIDDRRGWRLLSRNDRGWRAVASGGERNEMELGVLIGLIVVAPILWQVPRTFWPLHLNSTATGFTGLYRRYSIDTFTGHASNVQTSTDTQTIGSISAHTSGTVIGG